MMKTLNENHRQASALTRGANRAGGSRRLCFNIRSIAAWVHARRRNGEEGGALVEFVLVLPLMLTMMTGMFSVVMALMNYQELGSATNAAAQLLITARGNLTDPCASVASTVTGALPTWTSTKFTYTVTLPDSTGAIHTYGPTTPTSGAPFTCTAGATVLNNAEGNPASVSVTYQYTWIPAYLLKLAGNLAASTTVMVD